jgi:hypothetical protein
MCLCVCVCTHSIYTQTHINIFTHTHTFLRQFVSHIRSLLMMQTNSPKRGSDFLYQHNQYFGSGSGFTQTIWTGSSLSLSREIALSLYVVSMVCTWTHRRSISLMGPEAERAKSLVNALICSKQTRVSFTVSIALRDSCSLLYRMLVFLFRNLQFGCLLDLNNDVCVSVENLYKLVN